jgi:hypothetical protein
MRGITETLSVMTAFLIEPDLSPASAGVFHWGRAEARDAIGMASSLPHGIQARSFRHSSVTIPDPFDRRTFVWIFRSI